MTLESDPGRTLGSFREWRIDRQAEGGLCAVPPLGRHPIDLKRRHPGERPFDNADGERRAIALEHGIAHRCRGCQVPARGVFGDDILEQPGGILPDRRRQRLLTGQRLQLGGWQCVVPFEGELPGRGPANLESRAPSHAESPGCELSSVTSTRARR